MNSLNNKKGTILSSTQEGLSSETFEIWLISALAAKTRDTKISVL